MRMTALRLASILTSANVTCAIVGGSVRDAMYGATPKDFDIVVWDKPSLEVLVGSLERKSNFEVTAKVDEQSDSSSAAGGGGRFKELWEDWLQLKNPSGVVIDILQAKRAIDEPVVADGRGIWAYRVQRVLNAFDVSMNQQALLIHRGEILPILKDVDACIQLKPLSAERERRMRLKADVIGLRYVPYEPLTAPYTSTDEDF